MLPLKFDLVLTSATALPPPPPSIKPLTFRFFRGQVLEHEGSLKSFLAQQPGTKEKDLVPPEWRVYASEDPRKLTFGLKGKAVITSTIEELFLSQDETVSWDFQGGGYVFGGERFVSLWAIFSLRLRSRGWIAVNPAFASEERTFV